MDPAECLCLLNMALSLVHRCSSAIYRRPWLLCDMSEANDLFATCLKQIVPCDAKSVNTSQMIGSVKLREHRA